MYFSLCFVCPARFCELIEDKERNVAFLKSLLGQTLVNLPWLATIDDIELNYSEREHIYYLRIRVHHYLTPESNPTHLEGIKLQSEENISRTLLQCFWEVNAFGC